MQSVDPKTKPDLCSGAAAAPRQFVFLSTVAVHHDILPRWKGFVDEDHPLRPVGLYGAYKAAVEAHLWDAHYRTGQHTCALRPCAVYGIDPNLERSIGYPIVGDIRAGKPFRRAGGGKAEAKLHVRLKSQSNRAGKSSNKPIRAG